MTLHKGTQYLFLLCKFWPVSVSKFLSYHLTVVAYFLMRSGNANNAHVPALADIESGLLSPNRVDDADIHRANGGERCKTEVFVVANAISKRAPAIASQ